MLILAADDVRKVLDDAESDVVAAVRQAYLLHARGDTAVPHSSFLRFPDDDRNRVIALPAYLGTRSPVCGIKWIASFPGNVDLGVERASAVMILNCVRTGRPEALLEASVVSARRTAASAALAAATLAGSTPDTGVSLVGCGVINFEVLAFLRVVLAGLREVTVYDLSPQRAESFAARCGARWPELSVHVADRMPEALAAHRLVSLATTASAPHLPAEYCRPGTLVLHLSLRDLWPSTILTSVNIVDDADHVCRAATSLHLAEQQTGDRRFITTSIGDILADPGYLVRDSGRLTVFSPFGLGILDLAVADLARRGASRRGIGTRMPDFLPAARPAALAV